MNIKKVCIENYRRISSKVHLDMDEELLIVGKNNTGKTSIFELFKKVFSLNSHFNFQDFNYQSVSKTNINNVYERLKDEQGSDDFQGLLNKEKREFPKIILDIYLEVETNDNYAEIKELLFEFENNEELILRGCFEINDLQALIKEFDEYNERINSLAGLEQLDFYEYLKRELHSYYSIKYYSKKEGSDYLHPVKDSFVKGLLNIDVINAQREVDDTSDHNQQNISNAIWNYYQNIKKQSKDIKEEDIYKESLNHIKESLDISYDEIFGELLSEVNENILDSTPNQKIEISSEINIEDVLKKNAKLKYAIEEHIVPESYNGLGYSNMLYIFIQIITYKFKISKENKLFNILFIEEPESHLHPQMQTTFLTKISNILGEDNNVYKVVTTHSSYILQSANVLSIRYFMEKDDCINIKNLSLFFSKEEFSNLKNFIQQYFRINTCDLFFADKAILIEGNVERILMPSLINMYDDLNSKSLSKQHITTIEVGGAYAHIFYELLDFLEIKSLVITDIDSVSGSNNRKCKCDLSQDLDDRQEQSIKTSNSVIKDWFGVSGGKFYIKNLIEKSVNRENLIKFDEKQYEIRKITFQTPNEGETAWGRTFEEQFIIENAPFLKEAIIQGKVNSLSGPLNRLGLNIKDITENFLRENYYEIVDGIEKTYFSLDLIGLTGWSVPKYIEEGFKWLET